MPPQRYRHGWIPIEDPGTFAGDTPVPSSVAKILNRRVKLQGQAGMTPDDKATLSQAIRKHGEPAPTLYRGFDMEHTDKTFTPGQAIDFSPVSTSQEEGSALPYAELGDRGPILFVMEHAKGLNIAGRAEQVGGFGESEWLTGGRFYVRKVELDDGIRVVAVSTRLGQDAASQKGALKKPKRL